MLRRRALMSVGGGSPDSPYYSLSAPVTTTDYDTQVKLFDTPKDFTILVEANANVYNWSNTHSMFGIDSSTLRFRVGRVSGRRTIANVSDNTSTSYYCGFACNNTSSDSVKNKVRSLYSRGSSAKSIRRIAITYKASTRTVNAFTPSSNAPNDMWWNLSADLSTTDTLKLNLGTGSSCDINVCNIYDHILSDARINDFLSNGA